MAVLDDDWARIDARRLAQTPFYCEENVWQTLQDPALPVAVDARAAVFITNAARQVAMWSQRAAVVDPVVWDYHVVVLARGARGGVVVDVDCTAGVVLPVVAWAQASFRDFVPAAARPRFRVVDAPTFLRTFSSDRSHMTDARGRPTKAPPPWPAPQNGAMNLHRFIDLDDDIAGVVCELDDLFRLGAPT